MKGVVMSEIMHTDLFELGAEEVDMVGGGKFLDDLVDAGAALGIGVGVGLIIIGAVGLAIA